MKIVDLLRCALSVSAVAVMLAGCGVLRQAQDDSLVGVPGAMLPSDAIAAHAGALLYTTAIAPPGIDEYTYPGGKYVQELTREFLASITLCVDTAGNLFVVASHSSILEYAHGGTKPIKSLRYHQSPSGCAADPTTGDLAVANWGSVSIYTNGRGTTTLYRDPKIAFYRSASYDDDGNLFVDGSSGEGTAKFAELPRGSSTFTNIALKPAIDHPTVVQWDGAHFAIGMQRSSLIRRVEVSGSHGKIVGTTSLGKCTYTDFFISGEKIAAACGGDIVIFKYPSGGSPVRVLKDLAPGALTFAVSE